MSSIPFTPLASPPRYGEVEQLSPLVQRVTAKNPGPFTYAGTGTYLIGRDSIAIIDPGPALPPHIDALIKALDGRSVSHILITHTHLDHSPASAAIKEKTSAPTYGFGPHGSGRAGGLEDESVEAGADLDFYPDHRLRDGDIIKGDGWTIEAVHTPGHTSNHLCFALLEEKTLFTGDHIMGWSTSIVSPPDGDMAAYMVSLEQLQARRDAQFLPTHGAAVKNPKELLAGLLAHRLGREAAILAQLAHGPSKIADLVSAIYTDTPKGLHQAAARSVLAHLIKLVSEGRVWCDGAPKLETTYLLASG